VNLDQFFCTSRYRADNWNRLRQALLLLSSADVFKKDDSKRIIDIEESLEIIRLTEQYWAFPGPSVISAIAKAFDEQNWLLMNELVSINARLISTDHYRRTDISANLLRSREIPIDKFGEKQRNSTKHITGTKPYFEILVIDSLVVENIDALRRHHLIHRRPEDEFVYDTVVVSSFEDALIALCLNYNIQCCILRYSFPFESKNSLSCISDYLHIAGFNRDDAACLSVNERTSLLGKVLKVVRPEIDLYLLSEASVETVANNLHLNFRRCFFGTEDYPEMRLTILKGIKERYSTPFFQALQAYSKLPTGVFHAMPISRSKSISKSHWIRDYGEFYGDRMFLCETSTTQGGLDSLLKPSGSLKVAQALTARAFESEESLFVPHGTSTANKIVIQAISRPKDIFLIAGDCHKSHYYSAILSDVRIVIVNGFKISEYDLIGPALIADFKSALLELRDSHLLQNVRGIILTNITFDGLAIDLFALANECLAIKNDLIFLIDEAWFAYGAFTTITRHRCAMHVANKLREIFKSKQYRDEYSKWFGQYGDINLIDSHNLVNMKIMADPHHSQVRIYSTQSTHKTLTALRQGSMIHINDDKYISEIQTSMRDAYQCFMSTSPNYQILASLDISRRQMHFEGYELVQKAYELACILRLQIADNPLLSKYLKVLSHDNLIPCHMRNYTTSLSVNNHSDSIQFIQESWLHDEICLDPSRVTIDISKTGHDGRSFQKLLTDRFDIQVNKTSRNTVLFIIHIGSTRGMITYLLESLNTIVREIDTRVGRLSPPQLNSHDERLACRKSLNIEIPHWAEFHPLFCSHHIGSHSILNIRQAYYLSRSDRAIKYINLNQDLASSIDHGEVLVSAALVTPYPPGYPLLLPGQIISSDAVRYLLSIIDHEIHGYDPMNGLEVFNPVFLDEHLQQ